MTSVRIVTRETKPDHTTGKTSNRYLVYWRGGGRDFKECYAGSYLTKAEAKIRRDQIAGELAAGRDPAVWLAALKTPPPPTLNLLDQWEAFMRSRIDVGESAQKLYRNSRDKWIPILGADTDPKTITARDIIDGISEQTEDMRPGSIAKYLSGLGMVLDYCDVEPNPAYSRKVKLPRAGRVEVLIPPTRSWFAIRDNLKRRSKTATRLIECCGLRVSEAASLESGDIDFINAEVRVRGTKTAAGLRRIPCPDQLLDELADILGPIEDRQPHKSVFGLRTGIIRYDLEKACNAAASGNYSPHPLRHRRISLWYAHGLDPITVKTWAGHANASMGLDTYGHIVIDPAEDEWRDFWLSFKTSRAAPVRHPVTT